MDSKRISFKVIGKVQGVFFRDFTVKQAKALSLTGYVKNALDGSVVGEAQGPEEDLNKLIGHLNKGSPASRVENVEHKNIATNTAETGFAQRGGIW